MDKSKTITSSTTNNKSSPFATIDDTTKTATSSNTSSSIKHTTGEETFDDPKRGQVKYKKETVLQEEKKISQQVTESHKVVTGRLEDVMPIIQKEAERYGHPQGQDVKLPSTTNPVVSTESRKSTYTTKAGSSSNQVPINTSNDKPYNTSSYKPKTDYTRSKSSTQNKQQQQPSKHSSLNTKLTQKPQFVNDNSPGMSPTSSPAEQMMSSKTRTVETVTVSNLSNEVERYSFFFNFKILSSYLTVQS